MGVSPRKSALDRVMCCNDRLQNSRLMGMLRLHFGAIRSVLLFACAALVVGGCSGLGSSQNPEAAATERNISLAAEGTALRDALNRQSVDTASTAAAAETYIVERESINAQLLATLRAVIPPTQQVVQGAGAGTPSLNTQPELPGLAAANTPVPSTDGAAGSATGTQYTAIVTASGVNSEDGCAVGIRNAFSTSDTEIYLTMRAFNVRAGTIMSAMWSLDGAVMYDDFSFSVAEDDDDFCIWFSIDPATVTFTPGNWTAQFFANGTPIEPAAQFTITG